MSISSFCSVRAISLPPRPWIGFVTIFFGYRKVVWFFAPFSGWYCALTNYFKCAFTQTRVADGEKKSVKHSKIETNHAMEQNCYNLLFCELDTLTPKFVVIQGKFYKSKQFYSEVERKYKEDDLKGRCKKGYIQWTKHKYSSGDSFYILWTYHPAAKGAYCWNKVVDDLNAAIEMLIRSCLF